MPTKRSREELGFTLIETIVVVAVLGLMLYLIVGRGPAHSPTVDLHAAATRVAQGMRDARSLAIARDQAQLFTVQPATPSFRVGDGAPQLLPRDIAVRLEIDGRPARGIMFLPDGSGTGGAVVLANATRRMDVRVDWLSGRLGVAEAEVAP